MADLPNRIRVLRRAPKPGFPRGWTQEQLAERIGCQFPHVSDLETGRRALSKYWMDRIARALTEAGQPTQPGDILLESENSSILSEDERAFLDRYRAASEAQREQLQRMADVIVPWRGPDSEADAA